MASIAVENVGPLRRTGRIDLKMVNLFIGKQSTGKSTLMKILCYCRWVEKKIMTGNDSVLSGYTHNNKFLKELMQFYRFNELKIKSNCLARISFCAIAQRLILFYRTFS